MKRAASRRRRSRHRCVSWSASDGRPACGGCYARAVSTIAFAAIVTGRIGAVYLSHRVALNTNPDRRAAFRSQWPMVVLMVCYTMTSLWIIAQPIVTTR